MLFLIRADSFSESHELAPGATPEQVRALVAGHHPPFNLVLSTGDWCHEYQVTEDCQVQGIGQYENPGEAVAACVTDHERHT